VNGDEQKQDEQNEDDPEQLESVAEELSEQAELQEIAGRASTVLHNSYRGRK